MENIPEKYRKFVSQTERMTLDEKPLIQLFQLPPQGQQSREQQPDTKPHSIYTKEDVKRESISPMVRYAFEFKDYMEELDTRQIAQEEIEDIEAELEYFKLSFISNFASDDLRRRLHAQDFKSFCDELSIVGDPLIQIIQQSFAKFQTAITSVK